MQTFCEQNYLQLKSIKEVHYLCIQLQRMFTQELLAKDQVVNEKFDFTKDAFERPTNQQETVLQQVIISGLSENLCRVAPVFDS